MSQHDAEFEAYQRIKSGANKKIPMDDGLNKNSEEYKAEVAKKKDEAVNKKILKTAKRLVRESNRGALNSTNMHYHEDEKFIQDYYRKKFTQRVLSEKNAISIEDEMLIDVLAYCAVRLARKAKLESMFGRFMDRTAPQDPVAQILNCIKSLGLKNNLKGTETGKEAISKLLGQDAEELRETQHTLTFDEWKASEKDKGNMRIERRALTDFADNDNFFKTPEQLEKEGVVRNDIDDELSFEM